MTDTIIRCTMSPWAGCRLPEMIPMRCIDPPAVVLCDPKYPHNVGAVLRVCSCFGIPHLLWSGER